MRLRHVTRALAITLAPLAATLLMGSAVFAWPGWYEGRPPQLGAGAVGIFLWHNDEGQHLRTHGTDGGQVYSGWLTTDGVFSDVSMVRAESTEELMVDAGGHTLRFRFKTYGHYDGVDFRVQGGDWLRVRLETNGVGAPLDSIYLGDDGRHPRHNPFHLFRHGRRGEEAPGNANGNDNGNENAPLTQRVGPPLPGPAGLPAAPPPLPLPVRRGPPLP
ncbi:MAG: hypothetical protein U0821_21200 [Chloroflexota bacterium]